MNDKKFWFDETGAATAEYAIATMAAVGFAAVQGVGHYTLP